MLTINSSLVKEEERKNLAAINNILKTEKNEEEKKEKKKYVWTIKTKIFVVIGKPSQSEILLVFICSCILQNSIVYKYLNLKIFVLRFFPKLAMCLYTC